MKKVFAIILASALCLILCFAVSAKDDNTWLCKGAPYSTGWWSGPAIDPNVTDWSIDVTFTTPNAFNGFVMACFADSGAPAVLEVKLYDKNDALLEKVEVTVVGDHAIDEQGFIQVMFKQAYAKGTYTVEFVIVDGSYFVLGSAEAADVTAQISGNGATNDATLAAPAMVLYGADAPAEDPQPIEDTPSSPKTADASVIAISAVAVIALAGIIVCKKIK